MRNRFVETTDAIKTLIDSGLWDKEEGNELKKIIMECAEYNYTKDKNVKVSDILSRIKEE